MRSVIPTTQKIPNNPSRGEEGEKGSTSDTISAFGDSEPNWDSQHRTVHLDSFEMILTDDCNHYTHQNSMKNDGLKSFTGRIRSWFQNRFPSIAKKLKKNDRHRSNDEEKCHFTPWPDKDFSDYEIDEMSRVSDDEIDEELEESMIESRPVDSADSKAVAADESEIGDFGRENKGRNKNEKNEDGIVDGIDSSYMCESSSCSSDQEDGIFSQDPRLYPIKEEDSTIENFETISLC